MIGLVLVSHSASLAAGVRELAEQMTGSNVPIAVAGGIDDPENPIGTDPMRVLAAIESVYSDDGVVVLMDLGSALMSAEVALEFLDAVRQPNVHLCEASFVEGALAAAVQIGAGSLVADVLAEARTALTAKQQHLAPQSAEVAPPTTPPQSLPDDSAHQLTVIVPNALGLHARPAARLVGLAGAYNARLAVKKGEHLVNARNMNQITLLDVRHGDKLVFYADGDEAEALLGAVQQLVDDNFGDSNTGSPDKPGRAAPASTPDGVLAGVGAARGLAVGTVFLLNEAQPDLPTHTVDDTTAEAKRLRAAVHAALEDIQALSEKSTKRLGRENAAIFEAHRMILSDETLHQAAVAAVTDDRRPAEAAWWGVVQATADQYRRTANPYIQARTADVLDVGKRVLRKLSPAYEATPDVPNGSILVAADLSPSDTAQLDPAHVRGIVTRYGGATSHTAIIARGLGIPAVVGVDIGHTLLANGQQIAIDGEWGWVHLAPTPRQLRDFEAQIAERRAEQQRLLHASQQQAVTADGHRIEVAANIGGAPDTAGLRRVGAEGVGLFRTELLFMDRNTAPNEDHQAAAYREAAENLDGSPVVVRTLDVGGDKHIPYLQIDPEENPFLGHRGVRYWLANEPLARTQLRAICRASATCDLRLMFPMVGTLGELQAARALLREVQAELAASGIAHNPDMPVGIMVEVPAAVLSADLLAAHVDFFSIGTNDLTQYIMAADRGNAKVNALVTPFQPAVLRAVKQVVEAAHVQGKWVGMCGEMAGNPTATPLLVGLGLDELSMSAPSIPQVKAAVRATCYSDAQALAAHVLTLETADEVIAYLNRNPVVLDG
jgi:multiphosphoryl transfer protein